MAKRDPARARLKALQKIGLYGHVKGKVQRNHLTPGQKAGIRERYKEYADILNAAPKTVRTIKAARFTPTQKALLKNAGYKMTGDRIFIPTHNYEHVRVKTNPIREGKGKLEAVRVIRKMQTVLGTPKISVEQFYADESLDVEKKLRRQMANLHLQPGEFYGIRDNQTGRFVIKHMGGDPDFLISQVWRVEKYAPAALASLSVVKTRVPMGRTDGAGDVSQKKKNRQSKAVSRKRQAMGFKPRWKNANKTGR